MQEVIHLRCGGETGFIQHIEVLLFVSLLNSTQEIFLQSTCLDSGFLKFLRGTRGRGEAFNLVALALCRLPNSNQRRSLARAGNALKRGNLVMTRKNLLNCRTLTVAEMAMFLGNFLLCLLAGDLRVLLLAFVHHLNVIALQRNHFLGGKKAGWFVPRLRRFNEFSGFYLVMESSLDFLK